MAEKEKGICRICLVPMRTESSDQAPMSSQLLFGEHYGVIDSNDDWLLVELNFDGSTGWIRRDQHTPISTEYYEQINNSDYKVCTDLAGNIFFQKKHVNILLGSILPISTNELFKIEEQVAFNGSSKSLSQYREFEYFNGILSKYMYTPYLPGGKSPFGIDEGGLIQQVFKICGYRLGRTLNKQSTQGTELKKLDDLLPGDVVFTGNENLNGAFIVIDGKKFVGVFDGIVQKIDTEYLIENLNTIRRYIHH